MRTVIPQARKQQRLEESIAGHRAEFPEQHFQSSRLNWRDVNEHLAVLERPRC
jgi:hypothetical protein